MIGNAIVNAIVNAAVSARKCEISPLVHALRIATFGAALLTLTSLSACNTDSAGLNLYGDTGTMVSYVRFEHRAYNLATDSPYDTVQLNVGAYSITGQRLDAPVVFEVTNHLAMEIDSSGMLRAKGPASGSVVRAYVTVDGVTRRDSVYVTITSGTPVSLPAKVSFELNPGDSAKYGQTEQFARGKAIKIVRDDEDGNNMSALRVGLWSSDVSRATITQSSNNATIRAFKPGKVTLYISAYAYGRIFLDSLPYLIGWPVSGYIAVYPRIPSGSKDVILDFHPKRFTVGTGACIHWRNSSTDLMVDIEFDDSTAAGSPQGNLHCYSFATEDQVAGNISPFVGKPDINGGPIIGSYFRTRVFTKPGLYKYRSRLYNTEGEILVCDEKNDPSCAPDNYQWDDGR